ncbi:glycosyltransferase [Oscillatoria sp. FACHB-1407]|uniref:glycosyltransferase n=1 Tax=Oscillatoria sp. FACHB-1407 TaxID=2692847 RepID=UPI001689D4AB|nr:glycosyltransferase [Oscillatoria sp. FACHB-1407]MBD2460894.1 glycosyltransferase [Oscillatoria sp. FACHB-1407]
MPGNLKNKATVAIIAGTYHPDRCGVAHYTLHLREALAQREITSLVLTTHAAAQTQDATVIGAVTRWRLADLPSLVQTVHRTKADLLHIQHAAGTYGFDRTIFLLPLALRLSGWRSPIVTTIHEYGWWEWQPKWLPAPWVETLKTWGQQRSWWDREDGFLLTQSDAIITTNADAQQVVTSRLPHLTHRVQQIPIGANIAIAPIPQTQARQVLRQRCGWADDTVIFAFFGFLHPVKGLETLLSAFRQIAATHPQARLVLIGGVESLALPDQQASQYWQKLQTQIADLQLQSMVHMTGYLDPGAVSECLRGADVGVLPFNHGVTLKSGSLLALMAHELPVIATRANPPDPLLEDRSLLWSIPSRDVGSLVTAMHHLMEDAERRQQLGQAGFRFSQPFTWSSIADAHQAIYQSVISDASRNAESKTLFGGGTRYSHIEDPF